MNASPAKIEAKKAKLETHKNCNLFCSKNCNDIMILRQKRELKGLLILLNQTVNDENIIEIKYKHYHLEKIIGFL